VRGLSSAVGALAPRRDRVIADVLFGVQIVCAVAMGTAQVLLLRETVYAGA